MDMTRTPQDFCMMSCHKMEMTSAYDQSLPISKKVLHLCLPDLARPIAGSRFSTYRKNLSSNWVPLLDTFERLQRQLPMTQK